MFSKVYKYIGIFIIALVLLGHHSLQAQAIGDMHHHTVADTCESTECHHAMNMEICEKIQSDEMYVSSDFLILDETSKYQINYFDKKIINPRALFKIYFENINISHKQLARSHL